MLPSSSYDSQVYLYALANPEWFVDEAQSITRWVFEALQTTPTAQRRVELSPDSAWLEYTAVDELWNRRHAPSLPDRAAAQKIAEELLGRLEAKCSDANKSWPASLRGMALLPPVVNLRRVSITALRRPDGSGFDHWLYRAEPQLTLDGGGKTQAGVFGTHVEVRVGHMGQPISVRSRWQPLSGERKLTTLTPFNGAPDDDANASPPVIKYFLEGAGVPQYYLAPYHFTYGDHDADMSSASPYSLTVDVGPLRQSGSFMTVAAVAQGGSGDYEYNWACYGINDVEAGIRELGPGESFPADGPAGGKATASSIDIDLGAYVILVNVKDRKTGAFKHRQQQVFPRLARVAAEAANAAPRVA